MNNREQEKKAVQAVCDRMGVKANFNGFRRAFREYMESTFSEEIMPDLPDECGITQAIEASRHILPDGWFISDMPEEKHKYGTFCCIEIVKTNIIRGAKKERLIDIFNGIDHICDPTSFFRVYVADEFGDGAYWYNLPKRWMEDSGHKFESKEHLNSMMYLMGFGEGEVI